MRELMGACKVAPQERVQRGKAHHRRPRTPPSSSSRAPSSPLAAAPSDRPILGASWPSASPMRSPLASNDSIEVAPPSTPAGETNRSSSGPAEEGTPNNPVLGQDPDGADSDEPVLIEFRRYGTNQPVADHEAAATDISISSDSDVNVVWCRRGEPAKRACGHQVSLAESWPANADAAAGIRQSTDTCGAAAAALSVAEMYALAEAYAAHRTPALARALMATVKADCDRLQERERSATRRAKEKERLESLTEEQRREEIRKRRATRQNVRDRNDIVSLSAHDPQDPNRTIAMQTLTFTRTAVRYTLWNRRWLPEPHPGTTNPGGRDLATRS
ncbi:hypothetical protein QAD02_011595 [Eretmocerus hayati]|uniref:Uncharacterized protein n=1 Tax=Eretmocerus hayati TaxID=131215 RepID=A0ACC2NXK5_9HYME|nr:hypothetical protein QAD02_011595 [Eretmocerus hayati]